MNYITVRLTESQKQYLVGLVLVDIDNLQDNVGLDGQFNDKSKALAFAKRAKTQLLR